MISISLCMIVKNEEETLEQCLKSVDDICEEIIIVDTGSIDRTKEIAKKFTNKIYNFKWIDDFSAARNYAFSLASMDYIMWLDADDIFLQEDRIKLKVLKRALNSNVDSVSMNYIIQFDEYQNPSFYYRRNRLVKRSKNFKWIGPVHEYLEVGGNIFQVDIAVVHRKEDKKRNKQSADRNLKIYEKRLRAGEIFNQRDLFYYANELKDHQKYKKSIIYYQKFLATQEGWVEDNIRACLNMAESYERLDKQDEKVEALLKTLTFDRPRPEVCCRLGDHFKDIRAFQTAIFWYHMAIQHKLENPQGFHHEAFSTWYPHLSLCVCYWSLGKVRKSKEHHELVRKMRPNDPKVLFNQKFFEKYQKEHKA